MSTVFSKIVDGAIPCYKVAENENFLAFLDINPIAKGHTLVIPKKETDYIFEINDEEYMQFFIFAKNVAKAMKTVINCKKIGIAVVGLEVPHAHIHLVPINNVFDLDFSKEKLNISNEDFALVAEQISNSYDS